MDINEIYSLLASAWNVWFTAVFVGIVVWAFWPKRRERLEQYGSIPLQNDD